MVQDSRNSSKLTFALARLKRYFPPVALRAIVLGVALLCGVLVEAYETALIGVSDQWRFRPGTNAPSNPITAWREPAFDDSAWPSAIPGFSTISEFWGKEPTFWYWVPYGNPRSAYLRRKFNVTSPDCIRWLVLRLDFDDGFVAYLNGQEVVRHGLTNDPVRFDDYATYHASGAAEEFDLTAFTNLLVAGENVLAIELHSSPTNEACCPNSLRVVPELLANFQRGPFVQSTSTNQTQIIWRTPVPADSAIEYGTSEAMGSLVVNSNLVTQHVLTLTNLVPGTTYYYRVQSAANSVTATSTVYSFNTLKPFGDITFLVTADGGMGSAGMYRVADRMRQTPADLVLFLGDICYPYFTLGKEDYRCLSIYRRQMHSVPFFFCLGNHDVDAGSLGVAFESTFYLPTNSVTGTEHFYSFDHGNAHFAILFVPEARPPPELAAYVLTNGSAQYNWLTNDLASSTKPWKFIGTHIPILGESGSHRSDPANDTNHAFIYQEMQALLLPVAKRYGVQMIFSGHDHNYERLSPLSGTYQIISGGADGTFQGDFQRSPANNQFFYGSHFTKVSITGNSLRLESLGTNGQVLDYMTLQLSAPSNGLHYSTWNSPVVESSPGTDGYGNIAGQRFDFAGTPILPAPGHFSNLGQCWVNNDSTNLYIGLEQAALYPSNNLFLFVESPRQAGVSNMAGLGDGLLDTAEGVDALDCLENLAFTNFTPSIACVLGDEFGDGQYRSFIRSNVVVDQADRFLGWTNYALNLGQGVFRLGAGLPDLAGVRVQQYNRSPQALWPAYQLTTRNLELNANFMEVAIPLSQLGSLQPGDTIKIAAVVGRTAFDTNTHSRNLDTSYIGSHFSGTGMGQFVLGATSVRLALENDDDGDGLANGWETNFAFNPYNPDGEDGAGGDPDHDLSTNYDEFLAGTNPRDPSSVLRLAIDPIGPLQNRLRWPAVPGRQYMLQRSAQVAGGYTNLIHPFFPCTLVTTNGEFLDDLSASHPDATQVFYRLRVAGP